LLATVASRETSHEKLDPSVGRSGPHAFAVRVGAPRQRTPPASIASCSNVRDDRDTPLSVGQDARIRTTDLPDGASGFFATQGMTAASALMSLQNSGWRRSWRWSESGRRWATKPACTH